ncbi:MAG: protein kinase [Bryobacteraceae bacterium]
MKPEVWKKIEELFETAQGKPREERGAFLDSACANEPELRAELELLLRAAELDNSLLDQPVLGGTEDRPALHPGDHLGAFLVAERIGRGGMGEVYRAHDPRLDRDVAIKVLPPDLAHDYERLRRFQAEARAVAALNHPNIISVHEIGNSDGLIWMATELVEGRSLRELLEGGPVTPRRVVEIAAQIADGLAAAHAAGIVHRDLKPENVMLSEGDRVKILDFGIAKWLGRSREALAGASTLTKTGEVVGTATAMSPEQVLGHEVDHRSDIFSLGVLLYEVLAGKHPFRGDNAVAVMHAIVEAEPEDLPGSVPETVAGIVRRCLEKSPERRFQTAADLGFALRMAANAQLRSKEVAGGQSQAPEAPPPVRSRLRRLYPRIVAISAIVLVTAGVLWLRLRPARVPFEHVQLDRLTTTGDTGEALISPDGRYVARIGGRGDEHGIWLRQLRASAELPIVPLTTSDFSGLHFSHDGEYLYYTRQKQPKGAALYRIPSLGGSAELVLDDVDGKVAVSPDEQHYAYLSSHPDQSFSVIVAGTDPADRKTILTRRAPDFLREDISWSPDGKLLALPIGSFEEKSWEFENLLIASRENGSATVFSPVKWSCVRSAEWLPKAKGLLVNAEDVVNGPFHIWFAPYPYGKARHITNEATSHVATHPTADENAFVSVEGTEIGELWTTAPHAGLASQLTRMGANSGGVGTAWTRDGRLVYTVADGELWLVDAGGANPKRLTFGGTAIWPVISPDDRTVYFGSERTGACHLWRVDLDGTNARQVTFGKGEQSAALSPDGKWLFYTTISFARAQSLWKIPLPSGSPVRIGDLKHVSAPAVSPDGQWLAVGYEDDRFQPPAGAGIMRLDGTEFRPLTLPSTWRLTWSPDGKSFYVVGGEHGVGNIWKCPVNGGTPTRITNFASGWIMSVSVSQEERLAFRHFESRSDVVLVRSVP